MGQKTFRIGAHPPLANVMKLSMNALIATMVESLAEGIALARKSGITAEGYLDIVTNTLFTAPVYKNYGTLIAEGRYRPAGFPVPLALKDMSLALDAARSAGAPLPLTEVVRDRLNQAMVQGFEDADWSALGALAAKESGLQ